MRRAILFFLNRNYWDAFEEDFHRIPSPFISDSGLEIIRIFTRLCEMVLAHKDILLKLEQLERKVVQQDDDIRLIFDYLKELLNPKTAPMRNIGFKIKDEE